MSETSSAGEQARLERAKAACLQKLTWSTELEATAASAYADWQYGSRPGRPQPYRCRLCQKWHLARSYSD